MRRAITRDDMRRYLEKSLSAEELGEFEARLREAGLADDVERPGPQVLFAALRPDGYEEPFDDETLLRYVRGTAEPKVSSVIDQLRRIDPELDGQLISMEAAKRQVDASMQLGSGAVPRAKKRPWFVLASWGVACAVVIFAAIFFWGKGRQVTVARNEPTVDSVLSTTEFGASTPLAPVALAALKGSPVSPSEAVRAQLASLATPTKDTARMVPARCLVLPESQTRLTWSGIAARSVTCTLRDSNGLKLAEKTVTTANTWVYRKPLPAGEYRWSAAWVGKGGKPKLATRVFRVVDPAAAAAVTTRAAAAGDPVSRSIVLAENGYTYQSLQMLDALLAKSPSTPGLKQLRDSIAAQTAL